MGETLPLVGPGSELQLTLDGGARPHLGVVAEGGPEPSTATAAAVLPQLDRLAGVGRVDELSRGDRARAVTGSCTRGRAWKNLYLAGERLAARAASPATRRQYASIYRTFGDWLRGELDRPPTTTDLTADAIAAFRPATSSSAPDDAADRRDLRLLRPCGAHVSRGARARVDHASAEPAGYTRRRRSLGPARHARVPHHAGRGDRRHRGPGLDLPRRRRSRLDRAGARALRPRNARRCAHPRSTATLTATLTAAFRSSRGFAPGYGLGIAKYATSCGEVYGHTGSMFGVETFVVASRDNLTGDLCWLC